jgi:hypothetical protein
MWKVLPSMAIAILAGTSALAATLDEERKSEFFLFFHFEPTCQPTPADQGRTWHRFRR